MKVWKDADEVIRMVHEVPKELSQLDIEMQKKPNFDKSKEENKKVRKK